MRTVILTWLVWLSFSVTPVFAAQDKDAEALLNTIEPLILSNFDEAQTLLDEAKIHPDILASESLQSHLYNLIAYSALLQQDYSSAADNFEQAKRLAERSGNVMQLAQTYRRKAFLFLSLSQYVDALNLFNEAAVLMSRLDLQGAAQIEAGVINVLLIIEDYEAVIQKGLAFINDEKTRAFYRQHNMIRGHLVGAYIRTGNLEQASLHLAEFKKIIELDNSSNISSMYLLSAQLELEHGNLKNALHLIELAEQSALNAKTYVMIPVIFLTKAEIYHRANQTDKAIALYTDLIEGKTTKSLITTQLKSIKRVADIYAENDQFEKAYQYSKLYNERRLAMDKENEKHLLSINQVKLEVTGKDNQIQSLTTEKALSEQKQKNQTLVMLFSFGALFAIATFALVTFRQKRTLSATYKALEKAANAKTQFLARMSHEIRTPINAITGLTHLSLKTCTDVEQKTNLEQIDESSQTLLGVINDVLDYSKIEAGEFMISNRPFDVKELVHRALRVISLAAEEKNIVLRHYISPEVPKSVVGDPLRLEQVLTNLLSNALKFTEQGSIDVSVKFTQNTNVDELSFAVKDTGTGIDLVNGVNVFESFAQADESITRKYGGTGLGLAISKQLVELMGGEIWVESSLGAGATFYFTTSISEQAKTKVSKQVMRAENALKVLIIDDSSFYRGYIENVLSQLKVVCVEAINGKDGIEKFTQAQQNDYPYDVVIIDWKMPQLDGVAVAAAIRQHTETEPRIIMLSNFDSASLRESTKHYNIDTYLEKPVDTELLINAVRNDTNASTSVINSSQLPFDTVPNLAGLHILIVDDNIINIKVASAYLDDTQATISCVKSGQEALTELSKNPNIDLIFMDLQMPIMDGFTATREIRHTLHLNTPIIAMTAHVLEEEIQHCLDAGMNAHLGKPINQEKLYQTILDNCSLSNIRNQQNDGQNSEDTLGNKQNLLQQSEQQSLLQVDKQKALKALLNKHDAYYDLVQEFIKTCQQNTLKAVVKNQQDLQQAKMIVHIIGPGLSYIGAFNLASFWQVLDERLKTAEVPLTSDTADMLQTFCTALEGLLVKLKQDSD